MEYFHDHFRRDFENIYDFADKPERIGMNLSEFLEYASSLSHYLHTHHNIEETYFFPMLSERMREFREDHPEQHKGIHAGLDLYDAYIKDIKKAPTKYSPVELRKVMDSFKEVLLKHLDEEVESLKGPNMSKYWTLDEVNRISV